MYLKYTIHDPIVALDLMHVGAGRKVPGLLSRSQILSAPTFNMSIRDTDEKTVQIILVPEERSDVDLVIVIDGETRQLKFQRWIKVGGKGPKVLQTLQVNGENGEVTWSEYRPVKGSDRQYFIVDLGLKGLLKRG